MLDQFVKAYEFVDKHNSKRSRIAGPRRIYTRDYLEEAVREAIINAIAHGDYSIQGDIAVSMYSDRMVVLSVGAPTSGSLSMMCSQAFPRTRTWDWLRSCIVSR